MRFLGFIIIAFLIPSPGFAVEMEAKNTPVPIQEAVRVIKHQGDLVPMDMKVLNEKGESKTLGSYFDKGPVILSMVYYECPSICGMTMTGLFRALKEVGLSLGNDFQLLFVSIDSRETPELADNKKKSFLDRYNLGDKYGGIHFLTLTDPKAVDRLAKSIGFEYQYDEKTDQYAHPSVAVVLTKDGKISQYHAGVDFVAKDIRLSLVEASANKIGTVLDHFFLYCYRYDPATGQYGLIIMNVLRLMGVLTMVGIGIFILALRRREQKLKPRAVRPVPT